MTDRRYVPVARRVFTEPVEDDEDESEGGGGDASTGRRVGGRRPKFPPGVVDRYLVFDTESSTVLSQHLKVAAWEVWDVHRDGRHRMIEEGLLHADDLPVRSPAEYTTLVEYCDQNRAAFSSDVEDMVGEGRELLLMPRSDFIKRVFLRYGHAQQAAIIGFNLPFDLARIAVNSEPGPTHRKAGIFAGGFRLQLVANSADPDQPDIWAPKVDVKHVDSKKSFIQFTGSLRSLEQNRLRKSRGHAAEPVYRGRFVDLRTLTHALRAQGFSLKSAGEAFNTKQRKSSVDSYSEVTVELLDYCRLDVLATASLYQAASAELAKHPVGLVPNKAFSPASIGKAYLRTMGVTPPLEKWPDFPRDTLGEYASAFYGGRVECRIRSTPVPAKYVDFTSMYPTVNALIGLWSIITADRLEVEDCTEQLQQMLDTLTLEQCLEPGFWAQLVAVGEIIPDGDVVPVRARWGDGGAWNIGVNPFYGRGVDGGKHAFWFSAADLAASKLLTGRAPKLLRATRVVPIGVQPGLNPVKFAGKVNIDPGSDPFVEMIRQRLQIKGDDALRQALKITANAGAYGVYAEVNEQKLVGELQAVKVHSAGRSWDVHTDSPETPGRFFFPPVAATITGAARLMLAMLERMVTDMGGVWSFADTDSMAIVSTKDGGLVECLGGPYVTADGKPAVLALSSDQVDEIRSRFQSLNPYGVEVPILKVEHADVYAWCVSSKRYCLFTVGEDGKRHVVDDGFSEHGLGYLLPPMGEQTPAGKKRRWVKDIWEHMLNGTPAPEWFNRPAVSSYTTTSPQLLRVFDRWNDGLSYADQVKPFNFILTAHLADGLVGDPRLIAPYEIDPGKWWGLEWADLRGRNDKPWKLKGSHNNSSVFQSGCVNAIIEDPLALYAPCWTIGQVVERYRSGRENKSVGGRGLLARRPVNVTSVEHVGKETNSLEDTEFGLVDVGETYNMFGAGPSAFRNVRRALHSIPSAKLSEMTGVSEATLKRLFSRRAPRIRRHIYDALVEAACVTAGICDQGDVLPGNWPDLLQQHVDRTKAGLCQMCGALLERRLQLHCNERCRSRLRRTASNPLTISAEVPIRSKRKPNKMGVVDNALTQYLTGGTRGADRRRGSR